MLLRITGHRNHKLTELPASSRLFTASAASFFCVNHTTKPAKLNLSSLFHKSELISAGNRLNIFYKAILKHVRLFPMVLVFKILDVLFHLMDCCSHLIRFPYNVFNKIFFPILVLHTPLFSWGDKGKLGSHLFLSA